MLHLNAGGSFFKGCWHKIAFIHTQTADNNQVRQRLVHSYRYINSIQTLLNIDEQESDNQTFKEPSAQQLDYADTRFQGSSCIFQQVKGSSEWNRLGNPHLSFNETWAYNEVDKIGQLSFDKGAIPLKSLFTRDLRFSLKSKLYFFHF